MAVRTATLPVIGLVIGSASTLVVAALGSVSVA
jgi:hypothetical protein